MPALGTKTPSRVRRKPPKQMRTRGDVVLSESDLLVLVGQALYARRLHEKASLREFGEVIGVSTSSMHRIEKGEFASVITFMRVCAYLGLDWNKTLQSIAHRK